MKKRFILPILALVIIATGSLYAWSIKPDPVEKPLNAPLYLNLIIHTEEDTSKCAQPKPQIPDYDGNEELMLHFTNALREFGEMAASHGAIINFGSDWTFSKGVEAYDPTFYTDLEDMGHEIDAHAHESCILYEEVREEIINAGGTPTNVASGMGENEIYNQMEYFDKYDDAFQILWGVALPGHGVGEEIAGWVWRPSSDNWLEHDSKGKYIYIGHGESTNSIEHIQEAIENRNLDRINTYAVFTHPREYKAAPGTEGIPEEWTAKESSYDYWENRINWWDEFLTEMDALENLEYASLTEIAGIFEENESTLDFNFDTENHPRSDIPAVQRQSQAGYP